MPTVLSTKKLNLSHKQLLLNSGIGLVEYDAIKVKFLPFSTELFPQKSLIFTSKNSVKAVLGILSAEKLSGSKVFCVGEKTKEFLEQAGVPVLMCKPYGKELAEAIVRDHKEESFLFVCGNIRREELPAILQKHRIRLEELVVYTTSLNEKEFNRKFDAVLFYSPSGVQSFCTFNPMTDVTAVCIGKTTASEAEKFTDKIIIATKPSIENTIVQAVKLFRQT